MSSTTEPTARHHKVSSVWYAIKRLRAFIHSDLSFLSIAHQADFYTALKIGNILEEHFIDKGIIYKETTSSLDMSVHQAMAYLKKVYFSRKAIL